MQLRHTSISKKLFSMKQLLNRNFLKALSINTKSTNGYRSRCNNAHEENAIFPFFNFRSRNSQQIRLFTVFMARKVQETAFLSLFST